METERKVVGVVVMVCVCVYRANTVHANKGDSLRSENAVVYSITDLRPRLSPHCQTDTSGGAAKTLPGF